MSIITSDLQNKSKEAFNFIMNAASTGTGVVRSALERIAETVSSQFGDNLNLFVFESRSDQAFVTSLAWGVSCAALQPSPLPLALGTLLVNGFVSTSKTDVINEMLSIKQQDRAEELKANKITSCFHQKVSTEMAHVNVFATTVFSLIGSLELSTFSSDVASNLLYGVLGTTLSVNAYHFVCRRSLN